MRKLTNEVKVNKCIQRTRNYREEARLFSDGEAVLSVSGGPAFYDVSLSGRFPGDESELENTKQGDNPPGRRRGR